MGALGSDTGGSIRQPASYSGIVGVKPTYGRCSRYGMIAYASSLDQAGVFGKTVSDAALLLESICGYDSKDSTSKKLPVPKLIKGIGEGVRGLKIGIPKEYNVKGLDEEISDTWKKGIKWLEDAGAEVIDISLPNTERALATYYIIAPAEASSNLARYDGVRYGLRNMDAENSFDEMIIKTRTEGFGKEVKRRIMIGTYVLSASHYGAYYTKAQKIRRLIAKDFQTAFSKVDAILVPTAPTAAFVIDDQPKDPLTEYLNDVFTVPVSLAGLPCMSVPARLNSDGLPLGLQVVGNLYQEELMLKVGKVLEEYAKFSKLII